MSVRPMTHKMGKTQGYLDVTFRSLPSLKLKIYKIKWNLNLNSSHVASGTIRGLDEFGTLAECLIQLDLVPLVVSQPLRGIVSAARGIVQGAVQGTLNGLLYGDWGGKAVVLGVSQFKIFTDQGEVEWLTKILEPIEFEKDMEAAKRVRGKAGEIMGDVRDGVFNLLSEMI